MLKRIRAVAVALAMAAGAIALAPPATASAAPAVGDVTVNPDPIVVNGPAVDAVFTLVTKEADRAELQIKAPGAGAWTPLTLTRSDDGGQTKWTATRQFDRDSRPGRWSVLAIAHGAGGASDSDNSGFVVRRTLDTRIAGFDASPEPVFRGGNVVVRGQLRIEGRRGWDGYRGQRVAILFKADESYGWRRVASDWTDRNGRFWASVPARWSGSWKAEYDGRDGVRGSDSRSDHVRVITPRRAESRIIGFNAYSEPVKRGNYLRFKGVLQDRQGWSWNGHRAKVSLSFRPAGSSKWSWVKSAWSTGDGKIYTKSKAWRSGTWRLVFAGDSGTRGSVGNGDYVHVRR
jgi:hypothetical protein